MSRQRDREEFVAIMAQEGVPLDVARQLMRHAATLHRIAELECSSEAANRDRVPCPGRWDRDRRAWVQLDDDCLCRDYGDHQGIEGHGPDKRLGQDGSVCAMNSHIMLQEATRHAHDRARRVKETVYIFHVGLDEYGRRDVWYVRTAAEGVPLDHRTGRLAPVVYEFAP